MSVITRLSDRIEVAREVMNYVSSSRTTWVKTIPMMRALGVKDNTGNRDTFRSVLNAMVAKGLLQRTGSGNFLWRIAAPVQTNGWDTSNPWETECTAPQASPDNKNPFGPGRLKLVGNTYDHKEELKLQCGARFDSDLKCWHIPDNASEKVRLQGLDCYKRGEVKIDWEASGYSTITEDQVVNRVNPPAASTNGHANGKPHAADSAELVALRKDVKEANQAIATLVDLLTKAEERNTDRTAELNIKVKELEKAVAATPKTIKVEKYDGKTLTLKNVVLPENFDRILSLAKCRRNILLVGPAGCGKSTIAKLVAQTLGLDFYKMGGSEGLTASHLLGKDRPLANKGDGKYEVSDFVTGYEKGGVVCLDEMDAFDANVFLSLNQALDRTGELPLPNRPGKPAKKHKDFLAVGTANTTGRGGNRMYVRNQLDASSLSRFQIGLVEVGYSVAVETAVCPNADLREALWKVRSRMEDAGLKRIIDTRYLEDAYVMVESGGWTVEEAVRQAMAGWTKDEMAKVG